MNRQFGLGDATFQAVGGEAGVERLVDTFYTLMENDPVYQPIWRQHTGEPANMRARLAAFLCGWMGGPRRYKERYGSINLPGAHQHLKVTEVERDLWIKCMRTALDECEYPQDIKTYLVAQLSVPAERIRVVCENIARASAT